MYINAHTYRQTDDEAFELVNSGPLADIRSGHYSCGLHPLRVNEENMEELLRSVKYLASQPACLAVGECGLDKTAGSDLALQQRAFRQQILLANELGKPLMIHCVKAFNELVNCLRLAGNQVPVIIHGFDHGENIARLLSNEGCYFSFGKALLGMDSNASKVIKAVGRKKLFLETCDSDLRISHVYAKAASLLGVSEEILKMQLRSNFEHVFSVRL